MPTTRRNTRILCAKALVWILLWCGVWGILRGQDARYFRHQAWSTEDGLPQNSVRQIYQTSDGFLWVATEGGVARFDGVAFQSFSRANETAFHSDDVCCLAESVDGALWIGTDDGLVRWKDGQFQRFDQADGLPDGSIRAVLRAGDGSLQVLTASGGAELRGERFASVSSERLMAGGTGESAPMGAVDGAGGERWSFSRTTVTVRLGSISRSWKAGAELPGSRVETVFLDRAGSAWIGTNDGLAMVVPGSGLGSGLGSGTAVGIAGLRGSAVVETFEDREGNYWVGTETSGLHVLRPAKFRSEPGLADQSLTGVVQASDGAVWVGTRKDGLRRDRNGAVDDPVKAGALTSDFILSMAPGTDGSVWAGTPDGLNHVSASGAVTQITSAEGLPDDYVLALASAADGTLWAGTRHGLVRLRGTKMGTFGKADGLGGELVGSLLLTPGGDLWIGSSGGLSRRSASGKMVTYTAADGLPGVVISGLAEDASGAIWIVSQDQGLVRFRDGRFQLLKSAAIGPQNSGVIADAKGYLWLRHAHGIDRVRIAELNDCLDREGECSAHVNSYGVADGMPSVEMVPGGSAAFWMMADGEMWSPTRHGAAIADLAHLPVNTVPPPVAIERFLVDDNAIDTRTEPIAIPYGPVRFTVEYAGLSYTVPSAVRYRFRLEGLEQGWTEAGSRRSATYTNLPPRSYRFQVQAMNNDGVWNEAGAVLRFRVVPPYYRRWWFIAGVVLLLAAMGAALYRLRVRRLRGQFDAVLKERNRMARAVHDTLAQDFVGVSLQLDMITQLLGMDKVDAAKQQVQETRKLVTDGLADARNTIWELRANVEENSLPTRLAKVVERYSSPGVDVELKIGGAFRTLGDALETEVLRIAQESLSNVQRHSGAENAEVELRYENDLLVLTVEDDGRGFIVQDSLAAEGHYGLKGMQERANLLRAKLDVTSRFGEGTKVVLTASIPPPQR